MKPAFDWIIVKNVTEEKKTESGIILAPSAEDVLSKSKVISIGGDVLSKLKKEERDLPYSVGSTVYHAPGAGIPVNNANDMFLLKYDQIIAVD